MSPELKLIADVGLDRFPECWEIHTAFHGNKQQTPRLQTTTLLHWPPTLVLWKDALGTNS